MPELRELYLVKLKIKINSTNLGRKQNKNIIRTRKLTKSKNFAFEKKLGNLTYLDK